MTNAKNKICVVIPCYKVNEQLPAVLKAMPEIVDQILVVDDHCPEHSGKAAEALQIKNLEVLYHKKNQGVGGATISGYLRALELESDIIVKLDGDGQMDPQNIAALIEPLMDGRADYAKGNRFQDFQALRKMPKIRLLGNSFLSFFVKLSSGYWTMLDPTNGYCAIRLDVLKKIPLHKVSKRYFFETDLLIHLNINRCVVQDVSMAAIYGDEKSNLSVLSALFTFPPKLIAGLMKRIFYSYYIYNFNMASVYLLVGIPFILFGILFGIYRWSFGIAEGVFNSAGTVMLVALPIILGVQFLLAAIQIDIDAVPKRAPAA